MARLTAERRSKLPKSDFAVPGKESYPVDTAGRARDALSRVSQFGSPQEKAQVRGKVAREYPGIKQSKGAPAKRGGNGNGERDRDRNGTDARARNGNGGNGGSAARARNGNGGNGGNGAARRNGDEPNGARNSGARNGATTQRLARELGRRLDERSRPRR